MKYGYSMLLGELINSEMIDYDDCKSFQIVCPSCREPIFKVKRDTQPIQSIHYLSHYEKSSSYQSDCELRVNSYKSDEVKESNQQSRNQKLKYFLEVLQETVLNNEYKGNIENLKGFFKKLHNSEALVFLRDRFFEFVKASENLMNQKAMFENFDEYINEIQNIAGNFPKTAFSTATQKRISFDVWIHLLSPNSKKNFDFMFNNSYLFLLTRIEKAQEARSLFDFEMFLHSSMVALITCSKIDGMQVIQDMMKYDVPKPHSIGLDLLSKMMAEISHEILGCLLRIPYFNLLKKSFIENTKPT